MQGSCVDVTLEVSLTGGLGLDPEEMLPPHPAGSGPESALFCSSGETCESLAAPKMSSSAPSTFIPLTLGLEKQLLGGEPPPLQADRGDDVILSDDAVRHLLIGLQHHIVSM